MKEEESSWTREMVSARRWLNEREFERLRRKEGLEGRAGRFGRDGRDGKADCWSGDPTKGRSSRIGRVDGEEGVGVGMGDAREDGIVSMIEDEGREWGRVRTVRWLLLRSDDSMGCMGSGRAGPRGRCRRRGVGRCWLSSVAALLTALLNSPRSARS